MVCNKAIMCINKILINTKAHVHQMRKSTIFSQINHNDIIMIIAWPKSKPKIFSSRSICLKKKQVKHSKASRIKGRIESNQFY